MGLKDVDGWRATGSYDDKKDKTYLVRLTPLHAAAMLGHARVVEAGYDIHKSYFGDCVTEGD